MKFIDILKQYNWQEIEKKIKTVTSQDVQNTLEKSTLSISDFINLVSPAAESFLEIMAQKSREKNTA